MATDPLRTALAQLQLPARRTRMRPGSAPGRHSRPPWPPCRTPMQRRTRHGDRAQQPETPGPIGRQGAPVAGHRSSRPSLDRRYEELQTVTELAHNLEVSFPLSGAVADVYRQAVRRYGSADGELLGIALLEQQAG
jgi:hypothetical protein